MVARWLSTVLAFSLLLVASAYAAADDKTRLGNHTIDRTLQLRTHSLFAPYIDQDLQNRWWDFGADAYVNTNKHVRLTRKVPSQMGWLWSRLPLSANNWIIELEFKISGDSSHLFGDGLAMWVTKDRAQPGPVFGSKDEFTGLGIFLDTYANSRHSYSFPRIMGMLGDGKTSYDFGNDGDGQALGGCSANFRRTNVATKLKVTYVKDSFLDVKIQYKAWDDWTDCFKIEKLQLPTGPFVGFSAMTGDVSDWHDIISITTHSVIMSPPDSQPNKMNPTNKKSPLSFGTSFSTSSSSRSSGTWLGFFFKLLLLCGVGAGGWYGYQEYQRRKRYAGFGGFSSGSGGFGSSSGGFGGGGRGNVPAPLGSASFHQGPHSAHVPSPMMSGFVNQNQGSASAGGYPQPPYESGMGGRRSPLPPNSAASVGGMRSAGYGDNYMNKRL